MKFLDTKYKKRSMGLTLIIFFLLAVALFVFGLRYMDPPIQEGIAVNFGTSNYGSGKIQPPTPMESAPTKTSTPTTEAQEQITKEEVATQEIEEAPVIKKEEKKTQQEEATKPIEDKTDLPPEPDPEPEPQPDKSTSDALSNILNAPKSDGSSKSGHGDDNKAGDKGDSSGDPNASSFYGQGKGLDGDGNYNLGGRKALNKERFKQECNESGRVVVRIVVDRNGNVLEATPGQRGTTNNAPCLTEPAKRAALATKFNADSKAPSKQIGTIIYNFSLSE